MTYHNEFACCWEGCGALVCFTPEQETKLRRTHEFWRCPYGHSQHFAEKTKEEKQIELLERKLQQFKNMYEWRGERTIELKSELRSVRARLGAARRKLRSLA